MNRRLYTACAVTAAIGAGLLMTACGGGDDSSASASTSPSVTASATPSATTEPASPTQSSGSGDTSGATTSSGGGTAGSGSADKSSGSKGTSTAGKGGKVRNCTDDDLSWKVSSETQAGGYFLVKATAKSGVTCVIPAALPVIAFGSDGTEAKPVEQSVGQPITLHAGATVYAGVNPKTTNQNGGKELASIILSVSSTDTDPAEVQVGTYVVDKPVVTNWHTSAADAVPFSN